MGWLAASAMRIIRKTPPNVVGMQIDDAELVKGCLEKTDAIAQADRPSRREGKIALSPNTSHGKMTTRHTMLSSISLKDAIDLRQNNFDLLRLCAALAVMFGHSFWIQPAHGRVQPILKHTALEYSGSLAVYTFFLISGMLIAASFDRQKSLGRFIAFRLARMGGDNYLGRSLTIVLAGGEESQAA
jgi:hypothetical protein